MSFSFDAERYAIASAVNEINRRLAGRKITLTVLRIVNARQAVVKK